MQTKLDETNAYHETSEGGEIYSLEYFNENTYENDAPMVDNK